MASLSIFALLASIPLLLYLWPSFLGGDTDFIAIYGTSMLPTIESGSFAVTKKALDYNVDDIVAYIQKEENFSKTIVHRIIKNEGNGFIIKGDNNRQNDPGIVMRDQIIGKVLFHIPYVGFSVLFMKNPLVLVLSLMAMGLSLIPRKKGRKNEKKIRNKEKKTSLFLPAVIINLINYMLLQTSISMGLMPEEPYLTFLLKFFDPYFASTISFATWFLAILLMYLLSRQSSIDRKDQLQNTQGTIQMKKERLSTYTLAQILLVMFIAGGMYNITGMINQLIPRIIGP